MVSPTGSPCQTNLADVDSLQSFAQQQSPPRLQLEPTHSPSARNSQAAMTAGMRTPVAHSASHLSLANQQLGLVSARSPQTPPEASLRSAPQAVEQFCNDNQHLFPDPYKRTAFKNLLSHLVHSQPSGVAIGGSMALALHAAHLNQAHHPACRQPNDIDLYATDHYMTDVRAILSSLQYEGIGGENPHASHTQYGDDRFHADVFNVTHRVQAKTDFAIKEFSEQRRILAPGVQVMSLELLRTCLERRMESAPADDHAQAL